MDDGGLMSKVCVGWSRMDAHCVNAPIWGKRVLLTIGALTCNTWALSTSEFSCKVHKIFPPVATWSISRVNGTLQRRECENLCLPFLVCVAYSIYTSHINKEEISTLLAEQEGREWGYCNCGPCLITRAARMTITFLVHGSLIWP